MNLGKTFFIVSVFQSKLTEAVNLSNHLTVYQALNESGLEFKVGKGSYNGSKELNFVIYDLKNENLVKELVRTFNQESYLTVYQDKAVQLVFNDSIKDLGTLVAVSDVEAENHLSWTLVDNVYYICK